MGAMFAAMFFYFIAMWGIPMIVAALIAGDVVGVVLGLGWLVWFLGTGFAFHHFAFKEQWPWD